MEKYSKFAVIGLGRFGETVAKTLAEKGAEVLGIDTREDIIENIRDDIAYAVKMDATDIKALQNQNIEDMDVVIVAIGNDFESLLLTTVQLQSMNIKRLITRANTIFQKKILEKIGIKEIIAPEIEVGVSLAEKLLSPNLLTFIPLPDEYEIVEIACPENVVNQKIEDINIRKKYNINIITVKRKVYKEGKKDPEISVIGVPKPETILLEDDTILLIGKDKDINRFIDTNS
ncbi:MAG: TrkA family potassium uptake protein [Chitinophagaceae bacterium]|nr:MAG: TrkA family potassium uptake protein [Chitinophagaceae bacterium]